MTTITNRPKSSSVNRQTWFVEPLALFMAYLLVFQAIAAGQSPIAQSSVAQSPVEQSPVAQTPVVLERKANPLGLVGTSPNKSRATTSIPLATPALAAPLTAAGLSPNGVASNATVTSKATPPANCVFQGSNYIIQYVCTGNRLTGSTPPDSGLLSAIQQFESDSIKQWLQLFRLSNTDADVAFFYANARTPMRNSVRALMLIRLIDIPFRLLNPQNAVTANEKTVYGWFQGRVQARIVQMDQDAVNDKNNWQNNRCTWQPDPDLEKTYGFFYIPCVGTQIFDTAPNADYFAAAAFKKDFIQVIANLVPANAPVLPHAVPSSHFSPRTSGSQQQTPSASTLIAGTSDSMTELLGIIGGSTAGVFGLTGITVGILATTVPSIRSKILPNRSRTENLKNLRAKAKNNKVQNVEEEVNENAEDSLSDAVSNGDTAVEASASGVADAADVGTESAELAAIASADGEEIAESAAGGPVGVAIGIAIAVITTIVTIIVDETISEQSLGSLDSTLSNDSNNAPNLFKLMQTASGQAEITDCWSEVTWPEVASTSTLPSAGPTDPVVISYPDGQPQNFQVNNFTYLDWAGGKVSPIAYGGQILTNSSFQLAAATVAPGFSGLVTGKDLTSVLQFKNWNGDAFWAAVVGNGFVVGPRFVSNGNVDCPAGNSGLTELSDLSNCSSFVANILQMVDTNGHPQVVLISTRPAILLPNTEIDFNTVESPLTVSVPVTGYPIPTLTFDNLPPGMIVNQNVDGKGTVSFFMDGTKVKPGNYITQIHATNYAQTTTTPVTFNITGPDFEAPPTFDTYPLSYRVPIWTTGLPVSQFFHATSAYQVTWSSNIPLPSGMSLSIVPGSNSIGFVGTPPAGSAGLLRPVDDTEPYVQACDGQNRCIKEFVVINIADAPRAQLVLTDFPMQLDFPVGEQRSYTFTTTGAITPVSFSTSSTSSPCPFPGPPSWVSMTDNGNGTVTFTGTAPGLNGVDQVNLANVVVHTTGLADPQCNTNNFAFFLDSDPQLFEGPNITVTAPQNVGLFLHSSLTPGVGTMTLATPLPNGLQFLQPFSGEPWSIGGTLQPGSGGQYTLAFQMKQNPTFGLVATQNLVLTVNEAPSWPGSSSIGGIAFINLTMMSGVNNQYVFKPGGFPTYNTMSITRGSSFMPQGVIFSTGTEINPNSGGAVLKGNPDPSTIGHGYVIPVTANNGIGNPSTMDVLLTIVPPGDVTGDGKVDCSDVTLVKSHLNAKAGTANYNGPADVNGDGVVNIIDLAFVTAHLAQGTVCH
jgi:Dockerin type I domain